MPGEVATAVASLRSTSGAILSLVAGLADEESRWKPASDRWSVLEVVNHLADEEVQDFRARLDVILHRPDEAFTPIDPQRWVIERRYAERDLAESAERLRAERAASLQWLTSLGDVNLALAKPVGSRGEMSARELLASWMAHDLLHLRQITRIRYEFLAERIAPLSLGYAGEWR